jgi:hypothetical protein
MLLLGYQTGAIAQAQISNVVPTLCGAINPITLPNDFVSFVKSNDSLKKMDILDVLQKFTVADNCGA